MDWLNSMSQYGQAGELPNDEETSDNEDFYADVSNGTRTAASTTTKDALPGAAKEGGVPPQNPNDIKSNPTAANNPGSGLAPTSTVPTVNAPNAQQRKQDNQKRAEELRAKLIANRQNTPNGVNTPSKVIPKPATPKGDAVKSVIEESSTKIMDHAEQQSEPSGDLIGIEALLQEGRAAAEAKAQAEDSAKVADAPVPAPPTQTVKPEIAPIQQPQQQPQQQKETSTSHQPEQIQSVPNLETEYYADLAIWLEVTGYHDIDYRHSKLRTYKERKALEQEAARIQEKLEKLKQAEQAEMQALRSGGSFPMATPSCPPPALPIFLSTQNNSKPSAKKTLANGVKRAHSPEPMLAERNSRPREGAHNGIRIRGANNSPQDRLPNNIRGRAASPLDRRVSYPDARRQGSFGERGRSSRDSSLERRQTSYNRNVEGVVPPPRDQRERYEATYSPPRENAARGRSGFGSGNGQTQERAYRDPYPPPPRGIRDVDQGRGGVRYFMIKSWNAENVAAAMRDALWSTQEKNERLLAEAFHTSRHVVLCFSVNNSKMFQGYALMTSPPDPHLPKPAFCAKLNWPTSPAFSLDWLATTAVHFRHVGHIKNEMNPDDSGAPCAVLIGKDGQEISQVAGRGLCEILDEVHAEGGPGGGKSRAW